MLLALTETVCLIVLPWIFGWIAMLRNPGAVYLSGLPMSPGWLALVDMVGILVVYAWYSLYKRISARISDGVPGYAFLDRVRLIFSLLAQTVIALIILLAIEIR